MTLAYKPWRTVGPRAKANLEARRETWPAVLRRADYRCEMCRERTEVFWAHLAGRPGSGATLGDWANSEALTAALCRGCHDGSDGRRPTSAIDQGRISDLLNAGAERLSDLLPAGTLLHVHKSPLEAVRQMVRDLEAAGVEPS